MMSTVRRALLGLGVAVSLLAGVPACGDEVAVDIAAARALAERGDADAQALLAEAYYFGNAVAQDYVEAARWSRLAAEQGHAVGQALLGEAYFFGNGVTQDYVEAVRWAGLAAEQGYAVGQARLGAAYYYGLGVG
ncbi:MAG: tetratricopeptide repeat protein, partial [Acidobacteria bacterium]|nr:tetratricopeptide repeat protein [Acidobacteriota bacterium]